MVQRRCQSGCSKSAPSVIHCCAVIAPKPRHWRTGIAASWPLLSRGTRRSDGVPASFSVWAGADQWVFPWLRSLLVVWAPLFLLSARSSRDRPRRRRHPIRHKSRATTRSSPTRTRSMRRRLGQRRPRRKAWRTGRSSGLLLQEQAANNIDVTSGSAVDVQATDRALGNMDVATTVGNAALTAYGYRSAATNATAEAGVEQATAAQAPHRG